MNYTALLSIQKPKPVSVVFTSVKIIARCNAYSYSRAIFSLFLFNYHYLLFIPRRCRLSASLSRTHEPMAIDCIEKVNL